MEDKNEEKKYEFMKQTIKKRPINKARVLRKVLLSALLGLVFGIVACFTVLLMFPYIQNKMFPETVTPVTIPIYEEPEDISESEYLPTETVAQTEEDTAEEIKQKEEEVESDISDEKDDASKPEDEENNDSSPVEEAEPDNDILTEKEETDEAAGKSEEEQEEEPAGEEGEVTESSKEDENTADEQEVEEDIDEEDPDIVNTETVINNLEIEDYKNLFRKISAVATETQRSIVSVADIRTDTDWFNNEYENSN